MDKEIIVEGTIEHIIFYNQESGYIVFTLLIEDEAVSCVGVMPQLAEGETIKASGVYTVHPSYGKQFQIKSYEKTIPTTAEGIRKYLASGVVKGVGAKLAKKIVDRFKDQTLDVIEEYPERLAEIKGINLTKAMTISAVFREQAELRRAMLFLQDYGITPVMALKIYKRYKERTLDVVQTNPYTLADEVFGIGFKTADAIAYRVGIEKDSAFRIQAGIRFCLSDATTRGHTYLPKGELCQNAVALLDVSEEQIELSLQQLQLDKHIWMEKTNETVAVYLNAFYYAENYVAKRLIELSQNVIDKSADVQDQIREIERSQGFQLAHAQKDAVVEALSKGVLVITGGPGTGKTTTIKTILQILYEDGYTIELAAPTGRAAKRMTETTGMEAKTIHRLLGITFISEDNRRQVFEKNEDNPIEADVIIIDESSMVDILLMSALVRAVASGTRLILVGDVDQLPSVGPGNVLRDVISSDCIAVVRLNEIFRQAQESAIVMNAHRINHGQYPVINEKEKDFFFVQRVSVEDVVTTILDLVCTRLPQFKKCDQQKDIQILTPMRKTPLGIENLNPRLQEKLNPPASNKAEKEFRNVIFREGDKVMQLKNNYNLQWRMVENRRLLDEGLGVFNGDEGYVEEINTDDETMTVCFDENKYVTYDFSQLDELDLAYAVTIHKSQGSEYKIVIIPIFNGPPMLLSRNLLYTAVTRAKELAVIVGRKEMLYYMVDNQREIQRFSSLDVRIQKLAQYLGTMK